VSRMSQLQSRFTGGPPRSGGAQETYIVSPYQNQLTSLAAAAAAAGAHDTQLTPAYAAVVPARPTTVLPPPTRPVEPTHFHWNTSSRRKRQQQQQAADADYKPRLNCTVSHKAVLPGGRRDRKWRGIGKIGNFQPITRHISETVIDGANVAIDY